MSSNYFIFLIRNLLSASRAIRVFGQRLWLHFARLFMRSFVARLTQIATATIILVVVLPTALTWCISISPHSTHPSRRSLSPFLFRILLARSPTPSPWAGNRVRWLIEQLHKLLTTCSTTCCACLCLRVYVCVCVRVVCLFCLRFAFARRELSRTVLMVSGGPGVKLLEGPYWNFLALYVHNSIFSCLNDLKN